MTLHILLDSYPLGALSHPKPDVGIVRWATACRAARHEVYVPEVIDYEVRRELLRAQKSAGLSNLNALKTVFQFIPINSSAMLLAAQALTLGAPSDDVIVATSNVSHISRFVRAELWSNIDP